MTKVRKIFDLPTYKMADRVNILGIRYLVHVLSLISTLKFSSHARTELTIGFKTNVFNTIGQAYV
jgi:hypothetical protein